MSADPLHAAAADARARREATIATGVIAGAGFVPLGAVLAERPDDAARAAGIGMIFAGGIPCLWSALAFGPSRIEQLADDVDAGVVDPQRALDEWRVIAEDEHHRRIRSGIVESVLGLATIAIGVSLLRDNSRITPGSVLVGAGVPIVQLGVRSLVESTPAESHLP
ncbi:MAG: hypothetical protein QM831_39650 [Kofleriaceae bacterium]